MKTSPELERKLLDLSKKGILIPRKENNPYLKVSYRGDGNLITSKWNVKIYTSGTITCVDNGVLDNILKEQMNPADSSLTCLQIDDSGWGFPLLGVMVGVCSGTQMLTDTIDVRFFRKPLYDKKLYLSEYSQKGIALLKKLKASPKTHRIEICTGHINTRLKSDLRDLGYDVRVAEIKGPLQDNLESTFISYVKEKLGVDIAYDPKEIPKHDLGNYYNRAVNWGKRHAPNLLKNGWGSLQ